jgi:hypothetical protein
LSADNNAEDKEVKGNREYVRNGGGTLLSASVSQKSSNTCAASLSAFCALQIIDEFMAPIEDPAKISNLIPRLANALYTPHS